MLQVKEENFVIPNRIQLESVFGCNASCTMCPVNLPSTREKGVMSFELYKYVIDEMTPYKDYIEKVDLWGVGEPLLDKNLSEKIFYAKTKGFKNIAIATNADLLNGELAKELYEAGLDTIIFSIDGISKEVHESIRVNTDFQRVVENAQNAINIRNLGGYNTKFVFRFIRQDVNRLEWEGFYNFWTKYISKEKGDIIIGYDAHNWGGEIDISKPNYEKKVLDNIPCHHAFDRLMVLCDGTVPLCCSDMHNANYAFGNVKEASPMEIFNSDIARKIRITHKLGNRLSIDICRRCMILESELAQDVE